VPTHAQVSADLPAGAGVSDLHSPPALPAANQSFEQGRAFAGAAAAFPAPDHVAAETFARREVLGPADIAGMVLGQADRPLLQRHLDVADGDPAVAVDRLLAAVTAEHETHRRYAGFVSKSCTPP
jgi:hypothetical protein